MQYYQTGGTAPQPPGGTSLPGTGQTGTPGTGQTGTPGTGKPADFQVNDKIKVAVTGPVNLRSGTSTSSGIITTLPNGTELCVLGRPTVNEGYRWYQARVSSSGQTGYVAGDLCTVVARNGCGTGAPPGRFAVNDKIKIANGPLEVRSTPGTSGTAVNPGEMQPTNALAAATRGLPESAITYARAHGAARIDDVIAYINEAYRVGAEVGIDAAIAVAQSAHETANADPPYQPWWSCWWQERRNPAGIGITGDPDENEASKTFASGVEAARAQLAHLHAYVFGDAKPLPAELVGVDPRYQNVFDAGWDGTVRTIHDLANQWAVDPVYDVGICQWGNQIFGGALGSATTTPPPSSIVGNLTVGSEMCVLEGPTAADGFAWYRIDAYGLHGWIVGEYCTLVQSGGCAGTSPGPAGRFAAGDQVYVSDGPLHLRDDHTVAATIVGSFDAGTALCVTGGPTYADGYEWYQVSGGWVAGDFCALSLAGGCSAAVPTGRFALNDQIYVANRPLALREEPNTDALVLDHYDVGTQLCVVGGPSYANGIEWYRVPDGWVAGDFCGLTSPGGCAQGVPSGRFAVNDRIAVTDGPLNLRETPTTDVSVLDTYDTGAELCVTGGPVYGNGFEWYQVPGGWVAGDYRDLVAAGGCGSAPATGRFAVDDRIYVADGPLNVRSAPTTDALVVGQYAESAEACVFDGPTNANGFEWYRVGSGGLEGWIAGDYCGLIARGGCRTQVGDGRFAVGDKIEVTDGPLNVRDTPTTDALVVGTFATWTDFCVLEGPVYTDGFDWYRMDAYGLQGWVAGSYCGLLATEGCAFSATSLATPIAPIPPSGIAPGDVLVVPADAVNLRGAASFAASVLATLPTGTLAVVAGTPTTAEGSVWQPVEPRFGRGWVDAASMEKQRDFGNLLMNPSADSDLTGIFANRSSTTVNRILVDGDYRVQAVNGGTETYEGVRYESAAGLGLTGARHLVGVVEVTGSGTLDVVLVRARYADSTYSDATRAPSATLSGTAWQRIVVPRLVTSATKTIDTLELHVVRSTAAGASFTFDADNAKVIEL